MNECTLIKQYDALVEVFDVELKGAYEGKYRATFISKSKDDYRVYVTVGSAETIFITNSDIISLIKEVIKRG